MLSPKQPTLHRLRRSPRAKRHRIAAAYMAQRHHSRCVPALTGSRRRWGLDEPGEGMSNGPGGGVALQAYAPPAPPLTMPAVFADELEVQVVDERNGSRLVAVIELVSPRNKGRADARQTFAGKCAAYL